MQPPLFQYHLWQTAAYHCALPSLIAAVTGAHFLPIVLHDGRVAFLKCGSVLRCSGRSGQMCCSSELACELHHSVEWWSSNVECRNEEVVFRPGIRRACADLMGECHSGECHIVRRVTQRLALVKYVFFRQRDCVLQSVPVR